VEVVVVLLAVGVLEVGLRLVLLVPRAKGEAGRVNGSLLVNCNSSAVAGCAGKSKSLPSLPNTFICTVSSGALCGRAVLVLVEAAVGGVDVMVSWCGAVFGGVM
jgi:hypothetical protein